MATVTQQHDPNSTGVLSPLRLQLSEKGERYKVEMVGSRVTVYIRESGEWAWLSDGTWRSGRLEGAHAVRDDLHGV